MNKNRILLFTATAFLASCSMAPKYAMPEVENAAAYKELDGKWQVAAAEPGVADTTAWWTVFQDDTLNTLETPRSGRRLCASGAIARHLSQRAFRPLPGCECRCEYLAFGLADHAIGHDL
jgi:hypothetical protein